MRRAGADGERQVEHEDLRRIPAVDEAVLPEDVAAALPAASPAPPWTCRASAVVWAHRPSAAAGSVLPAALPGRRPVLLTVAGFVAYADSPVGSYREVFAGLVAGGPVPRSHVPFMAVDSLASLHGGRSGWSLPKTAARFEGRPPDRALRAEGDGWLLDVDVRSRGPTLPGGWRLTVVQVWPDGKARSFAVILRGRFRPALVDVDVRSSGALASWLLPGRHLALTWPAARLVVHPPSAASPDAGSEDADGRSLGRDKG